jgi:transposase-like protein
LAEHLGYENGDPAGRGSGNNRNGSTTKTVLTDIGAVPVTMPRDRRRRFRAEDGPQNTPFGDDGASSP